MNEEKKLEEEELQKLQYLNQRYNTILGYLGEAEVLVHGLEEQLKKVKSEKQGYISDYVTLKTESESFSNSLLEKYGPGKIDINTGKIESV